MCFLSKSVLYNIREVSLMGWCARGKANCGVGIMCEVGGVSIKLFLTFDQKSLQQKECKAILRILSPPLHKGSSRLCNARPR